MSDPVADPRARDLLAAHPDDVAALGATFRGAAGESETTAVGLDAARHDATWTGRAADAFRRAVGRLPPVLGRVRAGYAAVADALAAYEPELARLQGGFTVVVAERTEIEGRLRAAEATARMAHTDLAARRGGAPPWGARPDAELAAARADGAVVAYRAQLAALTQRAFALLDEFATARDACRDAVAAAQQTAPVRPSGQGITVIGAARGVAAPAAGAYPDPSGR